MKIKYYTKHFSFTLPIFIVCLLLCACSKLSGKHKVDSLDIGMDTWCKNSSEMDDNPVLSPWSKKLFRAIDHNDESTVRTLLTDLDNDDIEYLFEMRPENMSSFLHEAAGKRGTNALAIMDLLLDKMKPLLLDKNGSDNLLYEQYKIIHLVQSSFFWDKNKMKEYLEKGPYKNSALLWKNAYEETPLGVAMQRGSIEIVQLLLKVTHHYVGLNHTAHRDSAGNDLLDIALEQKDPHKLTYLIKEVHNCSDRSATSTCMHFSGMSKCQSEAVIQALISNKKKLERLFKAVHHNRLELVGTLLDTIDTVLGPFALLEVLIKKCPCGPSNYTLIHTALDKNLLEPKDIDTVKFLTERLSFTLKNVNSLGISDRLKQQLKALLSNDANENLRENLLSLWQLAKDHKCASALLTLEASLRILELETPPGQFWSLAHH